MDFFKRKWVWLAPVIIILAGIALLFTDNYQKVTEAPEKNWSREINLGTTPFASEPSINTSANGDVTLTYLTTDGVTKKIYNNDYNLKNKSTYQIPVNKFTQVYLKDTTFLYSDYYALYNGKTHKKLTDIDQFISTDSRVFYRKDNQLYSLETDSLKSQPILKLENENASIHAYQSGQRTYLMKNSVDQKGNHITFYQLKDNKVTTLGKSNFTLDDSLVAKDLQFAIKDNIVKVLVTALQKQNMSGTPQNQYFYASTPMKKQLNLTQLSIKDPHGSSNLTELGDIKLRLKDGHTQLLFKAFGRTATRYKESKQFNIYKAALNETEVTSVMRLSNTPSNSVKPMWINNDTITWLDLTGDQKELFLSSSQKEVISKAQGVHKRNLLNALGKTAGMLSLSFLTIVIAFLWFIWPLIFLVIMMFSNNKALDNDHPWVFYTGIFIYLAATLLFKDRLFTHSLMNSAPDYLSFTGSSFIYLLGFGVLTYAILMLGLKKRDWSIPIQVTYFVGIHIAFIMVFFGPYLI